MAAAASSSSVDAFFALLEVWEFGQASFLAARLRGRQMRLSASLQQLGLIIAAPAVRGKAGPLTTIMLVDPGIGRPLTRRQALDCIRAIERRLGEASLVQARAEAARVEAKSTPMGAAEAGEVVRQVLQTS